MMRLMTASRPTERPRRLAGLAFVLLAMSGTVIGHAVVWSLVGGASPGLAAARSVHNYLRPVGGVLVILAGCASWGVWRTFAMLNATTARVRRALRSPAAPPPTLALRRRPPHRRPGLGTLWSALLAVQLCVYTVQENLEARAAHVPMPGIGVLTAQHGAPIALHAVVALGLAVLTTVLWSTLDRRHRSVEQIVRLLHAVTSRRGLVRPPAATTGCGAVTPLARFGFSFLPRPPPLVGD